MSNEKSLTKVRNNRIGIRRAINNVIELLKSKVNKDYTLSEDSPEFLRRNKDLILKTIKKDCNYLNQVPDDNYWKNYANRHFQQMELFIQRLRKDIALMEPIMVHLLQKYYWEKRQKQQYCNI